MLKKKSDRSSGSPPVPSNSFSKTLSLPTMAPQRPDLPRSASAFAAVAAAAPLVLFLLSLTALAETAQGAEPHPSAISEPRRHLSQISHITVSESELHLAGKGGGGSEEVPEGGSSLSNRRSLKSLDHISIPEDDPSLVQPESIQFAAASAPGLDPSEIVPVCGNKGKASISISGTRAPGKVWKGWGATLGRWANFVGTLPRRRRNDITKKLFRARRGLGLTIARYQIPGGYSSKLSPQMVPTNDTAFPLNAWNGFRQSPDLPFDWSADGPQRKVLLSARDYGASTFIAFSASPAWWMTASGDVSGPSNPAVTNLKQGYGPLFADYLAEVVAKYASNSDWSLGFHFLEPFNDPLSFVAKKGGEAEACSFNASDISSLVPAIANSLSQKKSSTKIAGLQANAIQTEKAFPKLPNGVQGTLEQVHLTGVVPVAEADPSPPLSVAREYYNAFKVASKAQKETWVSQWEPPSDVPDLDGALYMSRYITQAVNILQATAWVYGQAVDPDPSKSLLGIRWDESSVGNVTLSKKFWALKQWVKNAPAGSIRLGVSGSVQCNHNVASFYNPTKKRLNVFFTNQEASNFTVSIALTGFTKHSPSKPSYAYLYRTSARENAQLVRYLQVKVPTDKLDLRLDPQSLSTIVFTNVHFKS